MRAGTRRAVKSLTLFSSKLLIRIVARTYHNHRVCNGVAVLVSCRGTGRHIVLLSRMSRFGFEQRGQAFLLTTKTKPARQIRPTRQIPVGHRPRMRARLWISSYNVIDGLLRRWPSLPLARLSAEGLKVVLKREARKMLLPRKCFST